MKELLLTTALCAMTALGVAAGEFDATTRHVNDFSTGWEAGYSARVTADQRQDASIKAAGLCGYAFLVCKDNRK